MKMEDQQIGPPDLLCKAIVVSRYSGKKLPPHWVYIPSRKAIRELLNGLDADVRSVEFGGTRPGKSFGTLLLGYLERRVVDGAWCFYIRLWGVRESEVEGRRDELAKAVLHAIRESIAECLTLPAVDEVKPTQLLLRFEIGPECIVSKCRVKMVDQYMFSSGDWWKDRFHRY